MRADAKCVGGCRMKCVGGGRKEMCGLLQVDMYRHLVRADQPGPLCVQNSWTKLSEFD